MKKIISFSLWGDNPKYTNGAIENAKLIRPIYGNGWIGRFYCANTVPKDIIRQLLIFSNIEVIHMDSPGNWLGLFWRFYPASENDTDVMLSRDADSRLCVREKMAVDEWLASQKKFHVMRDHPYHFTPILGGMWGCRKHAVLEIKKLISNYRTGDYWQTDQNFLRDVLYPVIQDDCFVHDSFFRIESHAQPFPVARKHWGFVGQAFNKDNIPDNESSIVLRDYETTQVRQIRQPPVSDKMDFREVPLGGFLPCRQAGRGKKGRFVVHPSKPKLNVKKKVILFYNTMFGEPLELPNDIPGHFTITTHRKYMYTADAVVFHLPDLKYIPYETKPAGQLWVAWCKESDINYPCLKRPAFMRWFDLKMTYRLDSNVPDIYMLKQYHKKLRRPPFEKQNLINVFISSWFNQSQRLQYLKELMEYLKIDSYGQAFNNMKLLNDIGETTKEKIISGYKFTIAFENSIATDYVTEKFFQPLATGSVPIYLGAPNIDDFAPGKRCFINVNEFDGPKALATYIARIDADDVLYNQYMKWKEKPFNQKFTSLLHLAIEHPLKRLCNIIDKQEAVP